MKVLTPYRVLPAGSRRPASWKDESGAQIKQRTKEAAIQILLGFRKQIVDSANPEQTFIELASKESDCSSARDGGNLGDFGPGQMQKPFEDATFNAKIGEVTDVVDTDSGVHIILRYK